MKRNKDLYKMGEVELCVEIYSLSMRLREAKQLLRKRRRGFLPPEIKK